jgi:hypothetical protein
VLRNRLGIRRVRDMEQAESEESVRPGAIRSPTVGNRHGQQFNAELMW